MKMYLSFPVVRQSLGMVVLVSAGLMLSLPALAESEPQQVGESLPAPSASSQTLTETPETVDTVPEKAEDEGTVNYKPPTVPTQSSEESTQSPEESTQSSEKTEPTELNDVGGATSPSEEEVSN